MSRGSNEGEDKMKSGGLYDVERLAVDVHVHLYPAASDMMNESKECDMIK